MSGEYTFHSNNEAAIRKRANRRGYDIRKSKLSGFWLHDRVRNNVMLGDNMNGTSLEHIGAELTSFHDHGPMLRRFGWGY